MYQSDNTSIKQYAPVEANTEEVELQVQFHLSPLRKPSEGESASKGRVAVKNFVTECG